jgi:LacI family transcriptional regulator
LQNAGLKADPRYSTLHKQGDRAEGNEAMLRLLSHAKRKDFPTAFITYNIHMAAGALAALAREGRRVPGEFSIAAADFSPVAVQEAITAAGSEAEKLGRAAAKLVSDSTGDDDESFHDLILPSQLFLGRSTGPVR